MRSRCVGAIVVGLMVVAGSAKAADFEYGRGPYTVSQPLMYSWAGPYVGATLGYQWGEVSNNPTRPSGVNGGFQGGYNWQYGQWVFGAEADLQISGASDSVALWKFNNRWFGTLRGRGGYAMNNILFYGTAGIAVGDLNASVFTASESHTTAGWTAGVGAAVGLTPNWSAKFEYLYISLSDTPFTLTSVQNGYRFSVVRLGVNYRF
jgi:outer membrane immunogenic protein